MQPNPNAASDDWRATKCQLKIGFVAKREISVEEELFYDFGIKAPDIPWIKADAKKLATTLPKIIPQMQQKTMQGPLPNEENLVANTRMCNY